MEFLNSDSHLSLLYRKAKESFEWCIQSDENEFLKDELSMSFDDIVLIEKDIKIVFSKRVFEEYNIEVCLLLSAGNIEVGKYLYIENDKNEGIDDSLILY
ncbi:MULTISPECIES: hypothetical protein [unclassified Sphingobacterium]|uniref:hypothetical protein n=1 Tax=unclassified Sphingobacterium TaxID=2609468 RepID=UPI001047C009|nr:MULTISPECIES: hypothetical protein [unclassified Sphingobacterium]MCS3557624.1 hypothetical protein [Sphingobacterium sp. JUb21]TCQ95378.1 hypothetical protein EDF66_12912 [Sphingobacterium sp. JUb20]